MVQAKQSLPLPHELLPHRHPFLLIDRLIHYESGFLKAETLLTCDQIYFVEPFARLSIVPHSLLIEMMAQASAALYRLDRPVEDNKAPPVPGRIAAIEKLHIATQIYPGEQVRIESRIKQRVGGLAKFEARICSSTEILVEGMLILVSAVDRLPTGEIGQRKDKAPHS
jgi:3-hydroxyacyl-[acyl-carrier-protein] dehydratase